MLWLPSISSRPVELFDRNVGDSTIHRAPDLGYTRILLGEYRLSLPEPMSR